jgi:hypothetical protein
MKCQVDEKSSCWNGKLRRLQVGEMPSTLNAKLMKWKTDEMACHKILVFLSNVNLEQ